MLSHFHDAFYMHIFDPFFQSVAIREQSQQTCTSDEILGIPEKAFENNNNKRHHLKWEL